MIHFKLGDILRRASCFFLALLISISFSFPVFASSGQLATVGWAETVSAFLMSCGIYPYNDDEQAQFSEWSADNLTALYNQFVDEVDSGVANVEQAVIDFLDAGKSIVRLTSSLVRGVVSIASGRWSVLRAFATWIVSKYDVEDSQTGVELGVASKGFVSVPTAPPGIMIYDGVYKKAQYYSDVDGVYLAFYKETDGSFFYLRAVSYSPFKLTSTASGLSGSAPGLSSVVDTLDGKQYYHSYNSGLSYGMSSNGMPSDSVSRFPYWDDMEMYDSALALDTAFLNGSLGGLSGIIADTTIVSIPEALSEGAQFGGLAVQGAGEGVPLETLQEIIRDAVQDALKPGVTFVPVNISPDVDISADGQITVPVDVDIQQLPLVPSDYSAPDITSVFPFSIPWDVVSVFDALNAEPVRPDFQVSIYVPVLDVSVPFHIGVTDETAEAVDNAMSVWRNMLLVALCVGTLLLIWEIKS